jgi:hypothetical protein
VKAEAEEEDDDDDDESDSYFSLHTLQQASENSESAELVT